ncbi:hypothetical protein DJ030_03045 [bacterium endosymbiont of Escarpia laminata]|nr:MAG: hypothetical protein DJ031_15135 [bacterium endosymbiont of Escarpia laminata]RLJ21964.1 MAG: hypothetical protein DJ030_03045 [bacterium endosymbiont of Escarpia laminata]
MKVLHNNFATLVRKNARYAATLKYADFILNRYKIAHFVVSLFVVTPVAAVEPYVLASANSYTHSVTTQWGQTIQTHDTKRLLDEVELLASQTVILESNPDFIDSLSPALLLRLAKRIDVLDPSIRPLVQKEAISILENDVDRMQASESPHLNASIAELQSTLQYAHQHYDITIDPPLNSQPQTFIDSVDENETVSDNGEISLDDVAAQLEKQGIDPYTKEARPYYCAMGIEGLSTMGVYYVSFCSKLASR